MVESTVVPLHLSTLCKAQGTYCDEPRASVFAIVVILQHRRFHVSKRPNILT